MYKYSSENLKSIKFKFSRSGWFGICIDKFPKGLPGRDDSNGWMWATSGLRFLHNNGISEWDIGLGKLENGKAVEMIYDAKGKTITISCEGNSYTYTDQSFPEEVYFTFSLWSAGQKIHLLSN